MTAIACAFKIKSLWVLPLLLACFLVSCAPRPTPQQQLVPILVSSPDCRAPCWKGLTPGISSEADFLKLVDNAPDSEFDEFRSNTLQGGAIEYKWVDRSTLMLNSLRAIEGGTIINIDFISPSDISLATTLDIFGEPDAYTAEFFGAETFFIDVFFYYQTQGLVVQVKVIPFLAPASAFPPTCEVEIAPEMPVEHVFLLSPGTAAEMRDVLADQLIITDEERPWTGLGPITLSRR